MALIRPNNRALQDITTLPTASTSSFLTDLPSGTVLQVVHQKINGANYNTKSSSSFSDTDMSASITPTSTSSKIVIHLNFTTSTNTTSNSMAIYRITANGTAISDTATSGVNGIQFRGNVGNSNRNLDMVSGMWQHEPGSTSQQTYVIQVSSVDGATVYINRWGYDASWNSNSSITLMEIAG